MKATDLLKKQHDQVKKLFATLEKSDGRPERQRLLTEIARNLTAHMTIEQEIFYPACARRVDDKSIVAEAFEEHGVAALQLARTLDSKGADTTFQAKAKVLKELIEHHIEEEETELFKKARKAFDAAELEQLGAQMERLFAVQIRQDFREVLAEPRRMRAMHCKLHRARVRRSVPLRSARRRAAGRARHGSADRPRSGGS